MLIPRHYEDFLLKSGQIDPIHPRMCLFIIRIALPSFSLNFSLALTYTFGWDSHWASMP